MSLTKQQLLDLIILKLADQSIITADEHRTVENAIVDAIFTDRSQIGDIKEISCNQQYIDDNFEPSSSQFEGRALPGSDRVGWAICNGKNGTVDKGGNVSVGYSPSKGYILSASGPNNGLPGTKTHTLSVTEMPPHSHFSYGYNLNRIGGPLPWYNWGSPGSPSATNVPDSLITGGAGSTSTQNTTGGTTVPHNNMQPFIVTLFIQRVS
jgi:hypothetical protein